SMKPSKNAHSSSDIRSRAKLVSIADASLNHALRTSGIPFVNTTWRLEERLYLSNMSLEGTPTSRMA
ncbi:hypothetical protein, partial [Rhodovulum visakhapatnamense]|uniref:hypothetical protein n=1 Tax=Rhodovulum visakhapatnamense TaxID=364297 RepID=UPI001AB06106